MNVDISPNLPPMSSWTAAAPLGSGSVGGGSSTPRRSMRWIMWGPTFGRGQPVRSPYPPPGGRDAAARSLPDRYGVAEREAARRDDVAPDAERHVALAGERLERRHVGGAGVGVAGGDHAPADRVGAAQHRAADRDLAAAPAVLLPRARAVNAERHAEAA